MPHSIGCFIYFILFHLVNDHQRFINNFRAQRIEVITWSIQPCTSPGLFLRYHLSSQTHPWEFQGIWLYLKLTMFPRVHKHIMLNTISTSVTASNPHWVHHSNCYVYCQNIKVDVLCFPYIKQTKPRRAILNQSSKQTLGTMSSLSLSVCLFPLPSASLEKNACVCVRMCICTALFKYTTNCEAHLCGLAELFE